MELQMRMVLVGLVLLAGCNRPTAEQLNADVLQRFVDGETAIVYVKRAGAERYASGRWFAELINIRTNRGIYYTTRDYPPAESGQQWEVRQRGQRLEWVRRLPRIEREE